MLGAGASTSARTSAGTSADTRTSTGVLVVAEKPAVLSSRNLGARSHIVIS